VFKRSSYQKESSFDNTQKSDFAVFTPSSALPNLTSGSISKKSKLKNINTMRNSMMMETEPLYPRESQISNWFSGVIPQ
jgi:hypothetical protein